MSLTKPTQELEPKGFDYSRLDTGVAQAARAAADRFRAQYRRAVAEAIEVGSALLAVKDSLEHGLFGEWLTAEFGGDARTAQNYMALAREFGRKPEIVSDLPLTIAYKLASPGVPDSVREQVEAKARGGETLTADNVRQMIADGVEANRERRAKEREAERRSRLSDQERKDEDRREKAKSRGRAARDAALKAQLDANRAERDANLMADGRLAAFILECVGHRRDQLVALVADTPIHQHRLLRIALGSVSTDDLLYADDARAAWNAIQAENPASVPDPSDDLKRAWMTADRSAQRQFVQWIQNEEDRK